MQAGLKPLFIRKTVSLHDLGTYGLETIAYIKPVTVDGHLYHSVHAADGTPLTVIAERELAYATVRQHDLEPSSVH
jgi:hypothetical protein